MVRFPSLLKSKRNIVILALVLLVIGVGAFILMRGEPGIEPAKPGEKFYSLLTGNEVSKEESLRPLLGIMVENSEEARPQTGLDDAGIVFETVTEGGITRYLALYQEKLPKEVGPVRSVRPYFVDWLMGFDASVAHVGGSSQALQMIDQRVAKSLNQFFNSDAYYRTPKRAPPHNVYTFTKDLVALQKKAGHKTSKAKGFARSDDAASAEPTATIITIKYSRPLFQVKFEYDKANNTYTRSLAGKPHIDAATNKQISVKNLIVLKMKAGIRAIGDGEAVLYKDGVAQNIKWRQKDFNSRIELIDDQGKEVALNRGDSWFAVIPGVGSVSHK